MFVTGIKPQSEKSKGGEKTTAKQRHETGYHHRKRCTDQETTSRDHVAGYSLISARKFIHH